MNNKKKKILLSIGKISNKQKLLPVIKRINNEKHEIYATEKTYRFIKRNGIKNRLVYKISQNNKNPNLGDLLEKKFFNVIINIPTRSGKIRNGEYSDGRIIRKAALKTGTVLITDIEVAKDFIIDFL